jgi:hypothetical protein
MDLKSRRLSMNSKGKSKGKGKGQGQGQGRGKGVKELQAEDLEGVLGAGCCTQGCCGDDLTGGFKKSLKLPDLTGGGLTSDIRKGKF